VRDRRGLPDLALNIEKAHNLRERAIGVVRMYRDLVSFSDGKEETGPWNSRACAGHAGLCLPEAAAPVGWRLPPAVAQTDWMPGRLRVTAEKRESLADACWRWTMQRWP